MTNEEIIRLAREHDELMEEGEALFKQLEPIQKRVIEIRAVVEREDPENFDGIELLFGGRMTSLYAEPDHD